MKGDKHSYEYGVHAIKWDIEHEYVEIRYRIIFALYLSSDILRQSVWKSKSCRDCRFFYAITSLRTKQDDITYECALDEICKYSGVLEISEIVMAILERYHRLYIWNSNCTSVSEADLSESIAIIDQIIKCLVHDYVTGELSLDCFCALNYSNSFQCKLSQLKKSPIRRYHPKKYIWGIYLHNFFC